MAVQLGGQMPRPTGGFPAFARRRQFGLFEDDFDGRVLQHRLEPVERLLGLWVQHHHHHLRLGGLERDRVQRQRVGFQHHLRSGVHQRSAQAVAGDAGAGQQGDAPTHVNHGRDS